MCKKELPEDKYFQIVVMEAEFGSGKGIGKMITRIGGRHLCQSCAMGVAEVVNGDAEIRNVRRHQTEIDKGLIYKLRDEGMKLADIVKTTGYSRTSVGRALTERKKAAPK
jgi:hypothetical protein